MRERLVAGFVLFAVFNVVTFGVIRAYTLVGLVKADEAQKLDQSVAVMLALINERSGNGQMTSASQLRPFLDHAERVTYVNAEGKRSVSEGPTYRPAPSKYDVSSSGTDAETGSLTLERSGAVVDERIADAILPIVQLTLVLIGIAIAVGYVFAGRMSRPFRKLACIADDLGRGEFDVEIPGFSIREADAIGRALQASAIRLKELVRAEHEFASNASHQLRTPITALHLVLEDVAQWDETPPVVAEELRRSVTELDRLSNAVTCLLDMARGKDVVTGPPIDVSVLMNDAVARWRPQATAAERQIMAVSPRAVMMRTCQASVGQILDVLIENSLKHGVGLITLSVTDLDFQARLRVRDQGKSKIERTVFARRVQGAQSDGEGIGLSLAVELAASLGGYLTIGDGPTLSFDLMLPKR